MSDDAKKLVAERNATYKDAWKTTGRMLVVVSDQVYRLLVGWPEIWFCWVMIINKAARLLGDPRSVDSWKDVQGYAQLAIDYLEKEKRNEVPTG